MLERKPLEILLVLVGCVLAFAWARSIAHGGGAVAVIPVIVVLGIIFAFRYESMLPVFGIAMMWYGGGSPFVKGIPYSFYFLGAASGIALLKLLMRKQVSDRVPEVPLLAKIVLIALGSVLIIFVSLTILKKMGILQEMYYGAAGGMTAAVLFLILFFFTYLLLSGKISTTKFRYIPACALAVAVIAGCIDAVNFFYPRSVYYTYYLTTGVNFEVFEVLRGETDSVLRMASLRELGLYFTLFVISAYVMKGRSSRIRMATLILLSLGGGVILMAGFRNYIIRYALVVFIFFWLYDRRWAIASTLVGAGIWVGAIQLGDSVSVLPLPIQRVLGSLPGVYQTDVAITAMGGIDWRAELVQRFFSSEFWKHPWFGRGQVGDFYVAAESAFRDRMLYFEVTQLWHSGFASTLDMVGIVGLVLFAIAQGFTVLLTILILRKRSPYLESWMLWCILYFYASNVIFWYNGFFHKQFSMMAFSMLGVCVVYAILQNREQCASNEERLVALGGQDKVTPHE